MKTIAFIDVEVDVNSKKILDMGGVAGNGIRFHSDSTAELLDFINKHDFICGHNIIHHDLPHIESAAKTDVSNFEAIDTLFLSPLLFPVKPYHALLKDDKLQTDELNNPLNDAIKARDLFYNEVSAFDGVEDGLKRIFYALLHER